MYGWEVWRHPLKSHTAYLTYMFKDVYFIQVKIYEHLNFIIHKHFWNSAQDYGCR